jgi:hypothetical protein
VAKALFTVELEPNEANLNGVRERLGITSDQIDEEFGVVAIDPDRSLYTILVEESVASGLQDAHTSRGAVKGPFSNPRIENFGPPRATKDDD